MLNKVWAAMIAVSVFCALATGRMQQLSEAVLAGAGNAVQLIFGMMGMMCAWTGLMKIADAGGLTAILSRLLAPVLRRLFPAYPPDFLTRISDFLFRYLNSIGANLER